MTRFLGTAILGLSLDQVTKVWTFHGLAVTWFNDQPNVEYWQYPFIPGWLTFTALANRGAVFGIGQGQGSLFILISVAAIGFLCWLFATSDRRRFYQIILGMLLAGVVGNMYDRVAFGYVRDMIHALPGVRWPAWFVNTLPDWQWTRADVFPYIFNVADSLLCVGVVLMLAYSLVSERCTKAAPGGMNAERTQPDQ